MSASAEGVSDAVTSRVPLRAAVLVRPGRGLFDVELADVWRYRELLYFLVWRDTVIRYKQAALGVLWAVIQPVLAAILFTVIFGGFARFPSNGIPYPLFALTAVLPWTYFAEALRRSATGLVENSELIRKVYFPRLIVPLAGVAGPIVDFVFAFAVLMGAAFWYHVDLTWSLLFAPLFIVQAMLLALAFGLWLGPINVKYRDVKHTLPFLTQIWMFASPVVYPLSMVPKKWQFLYSLNPVVGVIEGFRWAVLDGHRPLLANWGFVDNPTLMALTTSCVVIVVGLLTGTLLFKRMERSFADVI